jgi:hypothetical protein
MAHVGHDIRVAERSQDLCFSYEAVDLRRREVVGTEQFERDRRVGLAVERSTIMSGNS